MPPIWLDEARGFPDSLMTKARNAKETSMLLERAKKIIFSIRK
jgi:hypothetical protein